MDTDEKERGHRDNTSSARFDGEKAEREFPVAVSGQRTTTDHRQAAKNAKSGWRSSWSAVLGCWHGRDSGRGREVLPDTLFIPHDLRGNVGGIWRKEVIGSRVARWLLTGTSVVMLVGTIVTESCPLRWTVGIAQLVVRSGSIQAALDLSDNGITAGWTTVGFGGQRQRAFLPRLKNLPPFDKWIVVLPFWVPAALFGLSAAWLWFKSHHIPSNCCQRCGYNLTGNVTGVCSECGTPLPGHASAPHGGGVH